MPAATVLSRNPDGSMVVRMADGTQKTVSADKVKKPRNPADSPFYYENARFPGLGRTGYDAYNFLSKLLPTAGAVAGGVAGSESGPGAIALAGAGAMTGDQMRTELNRLMYKGVGDESGGDMATRLAIQGGMGAVGEGAGQGISAAVKAITGPLGKSAVTHTLADAGKGIRLTPGEAADSEFLKRSETVLEHLLPGGETPFANFRVQQKADIASTFAKQLDELSKRNLTSEQVGKEVQAAVKKVQSDAIKSQDAYADVKTMLKLPADATKDQIESAIAKAEAPSLKLDPQGKPYWGNPTNPGTPQTAARARLKQADQFFTEESKRQQAEIVRTVLKTERPEIIGGFFEKAGVDQLRELSTQLPQQTKEAVSRNVLQNMLDRATDPQSGDIGARSLATSLKTLGPERGTLIFGPQFKNIQEASSLMNRIVSIGGDTILGRMHAAGVMKYVIGGMAGVLGVGTGHIGEATAALGAETTFVRLASLALTHPNTSARALNVLRQAAGIAVRVGSAIPNELLETTPAIPRYMDQGAPAQ